MRHREVLFPANTAKPIRPITAYDLMGVRRVKTLTTSIAGFSPVADVLLAIFAAIVVFGPVVKDARDWHGIVAGLFAAMAMGAQSVLVRLLMADSPQTNVMTGNMTQLGVAATELVITGRRLARNGGGATASEVAKARGRLITVLTIALGFLAGAAAGATAFATLGLRGTFAPVVIVAALALWAARERTG
jgi:uncharacterized membrane protein YoaK (UPF0700 family)